MSLLVFLLGLLLTLLSIPKVSNFILPRLINEGLLTPKEPKPEKAELIRYAGPRLSLFAVGIILMFLGIILRQS